MALMLNLATSMHRFAGEAAAWAQSPIFTRLDYPVISLSGRTLGLVGVGNIGGRVGEIAQALGMTIQCYGRPGSSRKVHPEWPRCDLETKQRAGKAVFDAICGFFDDIIDSGHFMVSVDIDENNPDVSFKRNSVTKRLS